MQIEAQDGEEFVSKDRQVDIPAADRGEAREAVLRSEIPVCVLDGDTLKMPACREEAVVAFVITQRQPKAGGDGGAIDARKEPLDADARIKGVSTGIDLYALELVGEQEVEVVKQRIAPCQRAPCGGLAKTDGEQRAVIALGVVGRKSEGPERIKEVGFNELDLEELADRGELCGKRQRLSASKKVVFGDLCVKDELLKRAKTCTDLKRACGFFFDFELKNDAIGLAAFAEVGLDPVEGMGFFKEAKGKDPLLADLNEVSVVIITFGNADLTADHAVLCDRISRDFDTFDANLFTFLDLKSEIDLTGFFDEVVPRDDVGVGVASILVKIGESEQVVFVKLCTIEDLPFSHGELMKEFFFGDQEIAFDAEVSVAVDFAFGDPIGDIDRAFIGVKVHFGLAHLHFDVAVVHVVGVEEVEIALDQGFLVGAAS